VPDTFAQKPVSAMELSKDLQLEIPKKGFISAHKADKWEESLLTGNGTIGALIRGNPGNEVIILSHENLFMPEYPPTKAPDIKKYLGKIRELVMNGEGEKAAELAVQAGVEAGIDKLVWTDPLVPACQLEIKCNNDTSILAYAKTVNYENGEATIAWKTGQGLFHQKMFVSRPAAVAVLKLSSPSGARLNCKCRLAQLPLPEKNENDDDENFSVADLISEVKATVSGKNLIYITRYKKQWKGSLKGYIVTAEVSTTGGTANNLGGWLSINEAEEIVILTKIKLFYDPPLTEEPLKIKANADYGDLLTGHQAVQSEMFNRFSINLNGAEEKSSLSEDLLKTSTPGHLNTTLVQKLCEAARYTMISSTGELPPTLQGIWGGTWRPAWSSDFTLNGNVPSAIACGLNGNFQEITEAYLNYMWSMFNDFKDNARDVYGADGVWVLSRTSDSGKTYHYLVDYPHMFWYAGSAWTAQFFYDYWLYTGDKDFLRERAVPFMQAALAFYEDIITRDQSGKIMFIPSYSPEIGPLGYYPAAINATMDVAALKQLLRNLITLAQQGWITKDRLALWEKMIDDLPAYGIDEQGDLKEWLWPGYRNNNQHRHASHLYPLFYEMDPDFEQNADLQKAAVQAIENRLQYRRGKNGAEMASSS